MSPSMANEMVKAPLMTAMVRATYDVTLWPFTKSITTMHLAVRHQRDRALCTLLAVWPDGPAQASSDGRTPVFNAAALDNLHAVQVMLQVCPRAVQLRDVHGLTVFHAAISPEASGDPAMCQCLVVLWPDGVGVKDSDGNSVLHYAAIFALPLILTTLLHVYPEGKMERNNRSQTPLDVAAGKTCRRLLQQEPHP